MNTTFIPWLIALVVIVLIALWVASAYNSLVALRNRVANGWSQIDVQLKQRSDLIPNLVNTVKGYASHESSVFTAVTQARAAAQSAASSGSVADRIQAEGALDKAIVNVLAVAEAYPELKANANFIDLQNQLKELESKIAYARQFYNDVVLKLNNAVEMFPTNIIAGLFHFEKAQFFEASETERTVPQVQF
ncbi:LemA family protein [Alloscardovia macacae]|uniref:LemA family protein n=1 Tax=Alloscardovia macacae TaxID=1160091 RepID=A0A261F553_9BIFI|nr:LemA family protein [Alloscardovia macacae]OZG54173.1 lemA family protein [Alloscardovia macacae]